MCSAPPRLPFCPAHPYLQVVLDNAPALASGGKAGVHARRPRVAKVAGSVGIRIMGVNCIGSIQQQDATLAWALSSNVGEVLGYEFLKNPGRDVTCRSSTGHVREGVMSGGGEGTRAG